MAMRWTQMMMLGLVSAGLLCGCASTTDRGLKPRTISVQDFAGPAAATEPATTVASTGAATSPSEPTTAPATSPATQPVVPLVATGSARPPKPVRVGEPVIVDSVIGQVAGRPIFANKFLESTTLNERLRGMSLQLDSREFFEAASEAVNVQLQQEVLNDLFLAEAQASLTTEQKMGLLAFMQRLREDVIGRGRGSELFTQSELAEKGMTLDQYLEVERDKTLINALIREEIAPRVIVSWKDVEREYQHRYAEFNPPASVVLTRLRMPAEPAEPAQQVAARVKDGATFEEIVKEFPAAQMRELDPFAMGSGGVSDIEIAPALKDKLTGLQVGQTTEPVVMGENMTWLHVQAIDKPPGKSLYDVQSMLIDQLRAKRFSEEQARYVRALFQKGIYTALPEMSKRILIVALSRYSP